jgi:hypothetical protein
VNFSSITYFGFSIVRPNWDKWNKTPPIISLLQKRNLDSERRILREKWTEEYICVPINEKAICLIYILTVLLFWKNFDRHCNLNPMKYKNWVRCSANRKIGRLKNWGFSRKETSSENNAMTVPPHWGQISMRLTCWLKKANIFPVGSSKKLFATHSARDMPGKGNCFQYCKFVSYNNDATNWSY